MELMYKDPRVIQPLALKNLISSDPNNKTDNSDLIFLAALIGIVSLVALFFLALNFSIGLFGNTNPKDQLQQYETSHFV
jgi:hypothetical protein